MSLALLRPRTAFVEPVGNSGMTDSGIYVFDHDDTRNMQHQRVTLLYRVLEQKGCAELIPGTVYVVLNPYNFTEIDFEGERKLVMPEDNFMAALDGYDEACEDVVPELSDAPNLYPVCGK